MIFHRYHGLGNDYLVCHHSVASQLTNKQIRRICDRHYGIGSDGLLIDFDDADIPTLRIINPDGSEARKAATLAHLRPVCLILGASDISLSGQYVGVQSDAK